MHDILWFQSWFIFIVQWKTGGIWILATLYQCRTGEIVSAAVFAVIVQDDYHDDNDEDYDKIVDVGSDESSLWQVNFPLETASSDKSCE